MMRFHAQAYVDLCSALQVLESVIDKFPANRDSPVNPVILNDVNDPNKEAPLILLAREACQQLGLTVSLIQLNRLVSTAKAGDTKVSDFVAMARDLRLRVRDELSSEFLFRIPRERASYYSSAGFDPSVVANFPSTAIDIEEAGRCFALGRWTACVFHLMRVMEHGLRAIGDYVGVPYDHKNWDPIIKKMRTEVDDYKKSNFHGNLDFLRQALDRLTAVQVATRNEVMHSRSFYDEERAFDIYRAVKSFMEQLATQLKGTP